MPALHRLSLPVAALGLSALLGCARGYHSYPDGVNCRYCPPPALPHTTFCGEPCHSCPALAHLTRAPEPSPAPPASDAGTGESKQDGTGEGASEQDEPESAPSRDDRRASSDRR